MIQKRKRYDKQFKRAAAQVLLSGDVRVVDHGIGENSISDYEKFFSLAIETFDRKLRKF